MNSLNSLTLTQSIQAIQQKKATAQEITDSVRDQIKAKNKELNIFLNVSAANPSAESEKLALCGVPFAVKDNFLTKDITTTASAKVLEHFQPPYESTVTTKLRAAGGFILGKTNMDAWAHGSSTETSDFGPTKNPRNLEHLPGGSSGGSAAAVAADMCIAAIGSETAGSIRQPSAWCGVVGLKPTYGRVSRFGVVAMGSSLDCPGPITKTVEDAALVLEQIAGHDRRDGTTAQQPVAKYSQAVGKSIKGMKIGVLYLDHPKLSGTQTAEAIEQSAKVLEKLGAKVSQINMSEQLEDDKVLKPDYAVATYTVVQRGEVSSNLGRYDGIRYGEGRETFGAEAHRRIMLGTYTLSKGYADKYYIKAQQVRSLYLNNFAQLFSKFDALIAPTSPGFALTLGASQGNPMFGEIEDMLVEPSSISGLPGVNVPCFQDKKTGLFLGLNIITNMWQEEKAITVASAFEQNTDWNTWNKK